MATCQSGLGVGRVSVFALGPLEHAMGPGCASQACAHRPLGPVETTGLTGLGPFETVGRTPPAQDLKRALARGRLSVLSKRIR